MFYEHKFVHVSMAKLITNRPHHQQWNLAKINEISDFGWKFSGNRSL